MEARISPLKRWEVEVEALLRMAEENLTAREGSDRRVSNGSRPSRPREVPLELAELVSEQLKQILKLMEGRSLAQKRRITDAIDLLEALSGQNLPAEARNGVSKG